MTIKAPTNIFAPVWRWQSNSNKHIYSGVTMAIKAPTNIFNSGVTMTIKASKNIFNSGVLWCLIFSSFSVLCCGFFLFSSCVPVVCFSGLSILHYSWLLFRFSLTFICLFAVNTNTFKLESVTWLVLNILSLTVFEGIDSLQNTCHTIYHLPTSQLFIGAGFDLTSGKHLVPNSLTKLLSLSGIGIGKHSGLEKKDNHDSCFLSLSRIEFSYTQVYSNYQ